MVLGKGFLSSKPFFSCKFFRLDRLLVREGGVYTPYLLGRHWFFRVSSFWFIYFFYLSKKKKGLKDMAWSSYIPIGTQILAATYTMTLRWFLEYFPRSFLGILYIVSKLKKSGIQQFKRCANWSYNKEDMDDWRKLRKEESKECQFHMIVRNGPESLFSQQRGNQFRINMWLLAQPCQMCQNGVIMWPIHLYFTWPCEMDHPHVKSTSIH